MKKLILFVLFVALCPLCIIHSADIARLEPRIDSAEPFIPGLSHAKNSLPGTVTIMEETFEGSFPSGLWEVTAGEVNAYWDDIDCLSAEGNWSAWCAGGGVDAPPPCYQYVNNMNAWMTYGPFDLSDATEAYLDFLFYLQEEMGYDRFFFGASVDGTNFGGYWIDTNYGEWTAAGIDFYNVPSFGSLLGQNNVWIGFVFNSDSTNTHYGAYVDSISLYKTVPSAPTPTPNPGNPSVTITIPTDYVHPFENFYIDGYVHVPTDAIYNVNLAFVLDIYGVYYFWPSWVQSPSADWGYYSSIDVGNWYVEVIQTFVWPDTGSGSASNLLIYGMLLDEAVTHIIGDYATVVWGYGP